MDTGLLIKKSIDQLKRNKMRSFLMILAVCVSIASISVIIAVTDGTKQKITNLLETMGVSDSLMIVPAGKEDMPKVDEAPASLTWEDKEAISNQISGVVDIAATQIKKANVKYEDQNVGTMVLGATPNWFTMRNWGTESGDIFTEADNNSMARVALIGPTVAKNLFGETDPVGKTILINQVPFTVKGVLVTKGASPDGDSDDRVAIPINTFSKRVFNVSHLSQLIVEMEDPQLLEEKQQNITQLLREQHQITSGENDDFRVRIPSSVLESKFGVTGTFTILMIVIGAVILIAGGIMVVNMMLASVKERTKEIGLYKAVGATSKDIQHQFFAETLLVSLLGGLSGIVFAAVVILVIGKIAPIPMQFTWSAFSVGLIFSILVGMVAGIRPAKKAAQLHPAEALRDE